MRVSSQLHVIAIGQYTNDKIKLSFAYEIVVRSQKHSMVILHEEAVPFYLRLIAFLLLLSVLITCIFYANFFLFL